LALQVDEDVNKKKKAMAEEVKSEDVDDLPLVMRKMKPYRKKRSSPMSIKDLECYNCGTNEHFAKDCKKHKKDECHDGMKMKSPSQDSRSSLTRTRPRARRKKSHHARRTLLVSRPLMMTRATLL
jgi:hypothetical protein